MVQEKAEMEEPRKARVKVEVLHERPRLSPPTSPNEPRVSRTITKDSAESALAEAAVLGPTWSRQESDRDSVASGAPPRIRFSRQESEASEAVAVTPSIVQRTIARGGKFGAERNSIRRLTVEARARPHRLITDKIEDEYEGTDDESNSRYASKQHPAQAVMTPGQVVSVWGATPSKEDRYTAFSSEKNIFFDGDFSRMRHRVGVMSHRGHKPESPNQDDFFVLARKECVLFGVLDGHGPEGHEIAHFTQERLPKLIMERLREDKEAWEDAVSKSVKDLIGLSSTNLEKEAEYSGTTFTIAMLDRAGGAVEASSATSKDPAQPSKEPIRLRCAFLGDSIAVFAKRKTKKEPWQVTQLTDIHRPDREDEARRILAAGGKVHLSKDSHNGARLLTPDWNLAMSRSFGDFHAVPFGLSNEPEFSGGELGVDQDHFVLVASDGVWDVIPPSQAVQLVAKYPPEEAQTAVEKLVAKAKMRWQSNHDVVDDITAVLIWPSFGEQ
jgi:serine/threonine protein phosphatase PrpC